MSEEDVFEQNDQLVLIGGYSGTGKSASLINIPNQEKWVYLNCEAGKRLPFRNQFKQARITDPLMVNDYFDDCIEAGDKVDGIIIDSLTFLMDMYESQYVIGSSNTMQGWSNYAQFFKNLMQTKVARFGKPVLIIAHVLDFVENMEMKTYVPIKGSLKNNGVEAYFSTVVSAKKVNLKDLESYKSDMLTITEEEQAVGYKHVFQTRITGKTVGERIRSPMGLFKPNETFINNDAAVLLNHLKHFYGG